VPDSRWKAALVSVVGWTLLYLGVHIVSSQGALLSDPAFLAMEAGLVLVHCVLGGTAFGLAVNGTRRWALTRLEADWAATKRLYRKRPSPTRAGRSEEDRVYKLD
jgi:hypothetical protein